MSLEDTQPIPILRDFVCPSCHMGTSRVGGLCLDCATRAESE